MSADDQRAFGHDCAHEDIRAQMDPCVSIEDARRRIASMYAGDNVSAEDIEACAQGYLAGWASALRGAKPAAFAAWLRARGDAVVNDDPAAAETLYLAAEQVPAGLSAPAWAALGEATDERDAAQLAMVEALESHTAQLRGARATIAELLRADEGAKAAREERWSKYLAEVRRLTAERDAAFTRGVEAMREAAAKHFARRSEGIEHAAARIACIAPTAAVCATLDEARRVADVADEIRALEVAP